jgi:hypothetical protein
VRGFGLAGVVGVENTQKDSYLVESTSRVRRRESSSPCRKPTHRRSDQGGDGVDHALIVVRPVFVLAASG